MLRRQEEDLRFIPVLQEDLLKAKGDLRRMTLNEEKHTAEFKVVERKMQELQAENTALKAKIAEQQNEIHREDGALDQYERKLLPMEDLQYEFRGYREKGREVEQDTRCMVQTNESLRTELDGLIKKQHDLKSTSEEIKLFVLQREV
jgi:chromosome segregation ATPase